MKGFFALIFLLPLYIPAIAQVRCGTDEQFTSLMQHNPAYARQMQSRLAVNGPYANARLTSTPDTIPVVVHIIYLINQFGTFGNVSDSAVHNMINLLNQEFNEPDPGDVTIRFYFKLAQTDPNCRPTSGIVRIDASGDKTYVYEGVHAGYMAGGISHSELAAKSDWDNTKYVNIWVVHKFSDPGIGGYAHYPVNFKSEYDGIVILPSFRGIAHEMGHIFGLMHTFEGSFQGTCPSNNNCNIEGDHVCDTPPVLQNTSGCDPTAINPCTNQPYGDVVYNHMSYSCSNYFTAMQRDRMREMLDLVRNSLLKSNTEWPPPLAPTVTISSDDADNIIDKWQLVTFASVVSGNPTIQYQWLKNNYPRSADPVYRTNDLAHGDEIVCMVEDPSLVCHVPVRAYSNKIKVSTRKGHYIDVYPNPVFDLLTVWAAPDQIEIHRIKLFVADGKLLDDKTVTPANRVQYSLSGRPAGIYLLEITSTKGTEVIRVIKGDL